MDLLDRIAELHPAIVHFPIALILAALLAELVHRATHLDRLRHAAGYCLLLGAIGGIPAAASGLLAAQQAGYAESLARVLAWHRAFGIAAAVLALAALATRFVPTRARRAAGLTALILASAAVGVTGYLGGILVHG